MSVNGSFVAWRVWRPGERGRVYRGQVSRGRLHDVERAVTPKSPRDEAVDGRLIVVPDGLVAWGTGDASSKGTFSRVYVWERAGRPRSTRLASDEFGQAAYLISIRPVDARHVLTNASDTPIVVGRPTRGSCPKPVVGTWAAFGDRQILAVVDTDRRTESDSDGDIARGGWVLVCDPSTGDPESVISESFFGDKYGYTDTTLRRIIRDGPWIVAERTVGTTDIIDTRDRSQASAPGFVDVPGVPVPADVQGPVPQTPTPAGVVLVPGAIASTSTSGTSGRGIVLRDATGRRVVGHGPPGKGTDYAFRGIAPTLTLDATTLTWTTADQPGRADVHPLPTGPITTVLRRDL
ncbi:hypothetical protein [Patulibacter sp.]|uniref:hypothetical protein n=1 Tax=Patulibacter sp. TaxID=1912859 RepID=UPI002724E88F|nr:hypothetical protein [Patulibacter sp.]MDO9408582.1 hypothetical protein [Patulibacter sp.]